MTHTHAIAAFIAANTPARRAAFNRAHIAEALKRIPPVCAACAQPGHTIQGCALIRKELFR